MVTSELYGELRPRAFAIAYRMLGSVSEAEDVVQEAFLRMHQAQRRDDPIASPRAYIATLVTRLAIDQLRSARVRRERYVGEWLPEPLVTGPTPAETAETADSLSLAFLVLLESLSPRQRAAFLLRDTWSRGRVTTSGNADRVSTPPGGSGKRWPSASSPPPSRATCRHWSVAGAGCGAAR